MCRSEGEITNDARLRAAAFLDRRTESGRGGDCDVSSGTPGRRAVDRAGLPAPIAARLSEQLDATC